MVVSFNIYEALNVLELIVVFIFAVFIFVKRNETFSKVIRVITTTILLIINVFQLPMEIQMDNSYGFTIFLIIMWFVEALMESFSLAYSLGKKN